MTPLPDNLDQSEPLRKLLGLKRYEQPPPGYFERLPAKVLARIQAGETQAGPSGWLSLLQQWGLTPATSAYAALVLLGGTALLAATLLNAPDAGLQAWQSATQVDPRAKHPDTSSLRAHATIDGPGLPPAIITASTNPVMFYGPPAFLSNNSYLQIEPVSVRKSAFAD